MLLLEVSCIQLRVLTTGVCFQGDKGNPGPEGLAGATGSPGTEGAVGLTGSPGESGKNVSVTNGNVTKFNPVCSHQYLTATPLSLVLTPGCPRPRWTPRSRWSTGDRGKHGITMFHPNNLK